MSHLQRRAAKCQYIPQMFLGNVRYLGHRGRPLQLGPERGHAGILDAAGDDPVERGKVRGDVEREAVLGRLAAHTDADGDDLALRPVTRGREPDTRTAWYAHGSQAVVGDGTDERLLQAAYVVDHVHPIRKRHDGVADELSGAVPGDLASPVDVDNRCHAPSSAVKSPASRRALTELRNRAASAPSTSLWSYDSDRYIMSRTAMISPSSSSSITTGRLTSAPVPRIAT